MIRAKAIDSSRSVMIAVTAFALTAAVALLQPARAQDVSGNAAPLSAERLDEIVGPIALYPDDLIAIVLPASTFPLQVVEAARLLENRKRDSSLQPDADWDDSVVALLNYPEIVKLMNDDLDWTWALGEAVLSQRADVLDAIQDFRDRAYAAGNLRTDNRQVVTRDEDVIEIAPADPEVIYVPYYEPRRVVVYQTVPVYHYYPWAYPSYCYPYPYGYSFSTGFFWGVTTAFTIGWHSHYVYAHPFHHHAHPYYGHYYHNPYYVRHGVNNRVTVSREGYVWDGGAYGSSGRPFGRTVEGRVFDPNRSNAANAGSYRSRTATLANGTSARQGSYRAPGQASRVARSNGARVEQNQNIVARSGRASGDATIGRVSPGVAAPLASPQSEQLRQYRQNRQAEALQRKQPAAPQYRLGRGLAQPQERTRGYERASPNTSPSTSARQSAPSVGRSAPPRVLGGIASPAPSYRGPVATGGGARAQGRASPPSSSGAQAPRSQGGGSRGGSYRGTMR
jgi:hypothetical protein